MGRRSAQSNAVDEKKGPWGVDHESRTMMLAQSLMAIIAEKLVLRQGYGLP